MLGTKYKVEKIHKQEWDVISQDAHMTCFGEHRPASLESYSFVVGAFCKEELAGYFTCIEMDKETLYIQHGGVFPNFKETVYVLPGYAEMLKFVKDLGYKQAWTRIENKNTPMLKLALKLGFEINGSWCWDNKLYLELVTKF